MKTQILAVILIIFFIDCKSHQQKVSLSGTQKVGKKENKLKSPEEWGETFIGLNCRLERPKDIFVIGEPINLGFRVRAANEVDASAVKSVGVRELVEKLQVIGPDGKRLNCLHSIGYPKNEFISVNEYTSFNIGHYYDIGMVGEYFITATFPSVREANKYLRSQTIAINIVEEGFINISSTLKNQEIELGEPIIAVIKFSTERIEGISFTQPSLTFHLDNLWSCPKLEELGFTSIVQLQQKPITYTYDLSSFGWDHMVSSIWPSKSLKKVLKPEAKTNFSVTLSGLFNDKRFTITSDVIEVKVKEND